MANNADLPRNLNKLREEEMKNHKQLIFNVLS
ncbi:hypothetical protein VCG_000774 [Vibrio cholerae 12129(1)]|nr:hypothetical protein VCG_000774 [Vibrio cholerae 12129(1)]